MFEFSVGEWLALIGTTVSVVAWLLRLENRVNQNKEKIDADCATIASVDACAKSVETLTALVKEHYATQISVSAIQGTVNTLAAQYSSVTATLLRVENKLDAIIMGNVHTGERRGGQ